MTMPEKVAQLAFGLQDPRGIRWPALLFTFIIAFVVAFPIYAVAVAVIDRQPPIYYIEAYAPDPEVESGKQVEIRFDVHRRRICQIMRINRYVVDVNGLEHAVSGYTVSPETRPGREVYDRIITVPETVTPGPASYYLRIQYGCNFLGYLGWPIIVESPRVALEVLAPSA